MVPIDRAAEATLMQNTKSISSRNLELKTSIADEESDDKNTDIWLTKVAQLLGAGTESDAASVQTTSKVSSTLSSGIPSRRSSSTTDSKIDPTPSLAIFPELRSLRELKTGDRSGTFVFLVKDKKRVVGEVRMQLHRQDIPENFRINFIDLNLSHLLLCFVILGHPRTPSWIC
jgi:hypothetical protein